MGLGRTRDLHGGAGRGDHQHAVVGAEHLVVDVHADHGVRAHRLRALLHFGDGLVAGTHQLFLIALAAAAEHVTQARAKILEHVHTGYHFAGVVVTRIMARLLWLVCVDTAILPSAAYA